MNKEKLKQVQEDEEKLKQGERIDRRRFFKKCLVGCGVVAAASAVAAAEAAAASARFIEWKTAESRVSCNTSDVKLESLESIVTFDTPNIISTLPDDVVVEQDATVNFAEDGQVLGGMEIFDNGTWQEFCPSFPLGGVYPGVTGSTTLYTDGGDIISPGTFRFTLNFVPDGGGPEEPFKGSSFEIIDPVETDPVDSVDIPSFDSVTGILDIPSIEIGDQTYAVKLQWDPSIQGFKLVSYALISD